MFRRGYRIIFVTGLVVLAGDLVAGEAVSAMAVRNITRATSAPMEVSSTI